MQRSRHDSTVVLTMRAYGFSLELVFACHRSARLISHSTLWASTWWSHPLEGFCIGGLRLGLRSSGGLLHFCNLAASIG